MATRNSKSRIDILRNQFNITDPEALRFIASSEARFLQFLQQREGGIDAAVQTIRVGRNDVERLVQPLREQLLNIDKLPDKPRFEARKAELTSALRNLGGPQGGVADDRIRQIMADMDELYNTSTQQLANREVAKVQAAADASIPDSFRAKIDSTVKTTGKPLTKSQTVTLGRLTDLHNQTLAQVREAGAGGVFGLVPETAPEVLGRVEPRLEQAADIALRPDFDPKGRPKPPAAKSVLARLGLSEGTPASAAKEARGIKLKRGAGRGALGVAGLAALAALFGGGDGEGEEQGQQVNPQQLQLQALLSEMQNNEMLAQARAQRDLAQAGRLQSAGELDQAKLLQLLLNAEAGANIPQGVF